MQYNKTYNSHIKKLARFGTSVTITNLFSRKNIHHVIANVLLCKKRDCVCLRAKLRRKVSKCSSSKSSIGFEWSACALCSESYNAFVAAVFYSILRRIVDHLYSLLSYPTPHSAHRHLAPLAPLHLYQCCQSEHLALGPICSSTLRAFGPSAPWTTQVKPYHNLYMLLHDMLTSCMSLSTKPSTKPST